MKKIIITGTSRGIGFALAEYYCKNNFSVIGISRSEGNFTHENYEHFICDISREEEVKNLFSELKKKHSEIDVLINNAAIASMNHLVSSPYSTFENIMKVNTGGTFLMMRETAKMMIRKNYGRIINFTTISAALNIETQSIYAASKAAVESMTKIAAKELAAYNITVNAIGPTPVETALIKGIPQEWLNNVIQMQAIKRNGTLEDIYNVCDFFIDEKSSFITGQILYLGGVT